MPVPLSFHFQALCFQDRHNKETENKNTPDSTCLPARDAPARAMLETQCWLGGMKLGRQMHPQTASCGMSTLS